MNHETIKKLEFSTYDKKSVDKLKIAKRSILNRISKYIPSEESGDAQTWDMGEVIGNDIMYVSGMILFMSPIIGHLEGMGEHAEEYKKITMAKKRLAVNNRDKEEIEEKTRKKASTKDDKDAESRISAEDDIQLMIDIKTLAMEYKRFHFQVNNWIKTAQDRLKALDKDRLFSNTNN